MNCSQCNEEFDEFELTQTSAGMVCEHCILDQADIAREIEADLKLEWLETQADIERNEHAA